MCFRSRSVLYKNNGDSTFSDVTLSAGLITNDIITAGATTADVNKDGHVDLFVTTIAEKISNSKYKKLAKNLLFLNNGNGGYHNFTGQASGGTVTSYITHNGRGYFEDGVQFDTNGESLSQYEEGSWTPVINKSGDAGSVSGYNNQVGRYIKIGNMLWISFYVYKASGSFGSLANEWYISGIPFGLEHSASGAYQSIPCAYFHMNLY